MKNQLPKAPKHLSAAAAAWWDRLLAEWVLDDAGRLVLQVALEAHDRMVEAQEALRRDGTFIKDRFGVVKVHPATLTERDSRSAMLGALKQLHLDLEPLNDGPGRPPGS